MSTYYEPELIEKLGTHVYNKSTYVPPGKRLVSVQFNGSWKRACDVTEKSDYDCFYSQYCTGLWLSWDLYLVPQEMPSHHKLPVIEYPDKIFDISNGMTLCEKCHKKTHLLSKED